MASSEKSTQKTISELTKHPVKSLYSGGFDMFGRGINLRAFAYEHGNEKIADLPPFLLSYLIVCYKNEPQKNNTELANDIYAALKNLDDEDFRAVAKECRLMDAISGRNPAEDIHFASDQAYDLCERFISVRSHAKLGK